MNQRNQPLLLSLALTILSLTTGLLSYTTLQTGEVSHQLILGTLPNTPLTYVIRSTQGTTECSGTFDISIDTGNNQANVTMRGWMLVSVFGRAEPINFEASLVFNALGQLSASIFRTVSQYDSMRLGTMGVNPITVQLYNTPDGTPPLLEQKLPGPIELKRRNGRYEVVAPQLPSLSAHFQKFSAPISLEVAAKDSCKRESAHAVDLTPFIRTVASLSDKARRILPAL